MTAQDGLSGLSRDAPRASSVHADLCSQV